eukprot:scaffold438011_cov17-Prasinocladus_malaysianus.AAC.1
MTNSVVQLGNELIYRVAAVCVEAAEGPAMAHLSGHARSPEPTSWGDVGRSQMMQHIYCHEYGCARDGMPRR